jgi:hypothetical protein
LSIVLIVSLVSVGFITLNKFYNKKDKNEIVLNNSKETNEKNLSTETPTEDIEEETELQTTDEIEETESPTPEEEKEIAEEIEETITKTPTETPTATKATSTPSPDNLLKNPGAETVNSNWSSNDWSSSEASYSFTSSTCYSGSYSLKINKTNTSGTSSYYQRITGTSGQKYKFCFYLKTSSITSSNSKGAYGNVQYYSGNNLDQASTSRINGTNGWTYYEKTFTLPSDAYSNTISAYLTIGYETGTAYFDNIMLYEID